METNRRARGKCTPKKGEYRVKSFLPSLQQTPLYVSLLWSRGAVRWAVCLFVMEQGRCEMGCMSLCYGAGAL